MAIGGLLYSCRYFLLLLRPSLLLLERGSDAATGEDMSPADGSVVSRYCGTEAWLADTAHAEAHLHVQVSCYELKENTKHKLGLS